MSLAKNPRTGVWEGDFRSRTMKRLHLSLRTTRKAEAMTRHEAVAKLVREGHTDLVDRLRTRRNLTVEQVEACHRQGKPFETLREGLTWPTVADAVTAYLASLSANQNRADKTRRTAKSQFPKMLAFVYDGLALGDYRVDQLPTRAVEALTAHLRGFLAPGTVTDHIMRLSALYTWLRKREEREARESQRAARLLHSPVDPETQPRDKPTRDRFLSADEIAQVLAATPDALRFPVLCGLAAGLRAGEVQHLRHGHDVDLGAGVLYIQKRTHPHPWKPKRGKEREVPMTDELRAAAAAHVTRFAGTDYMVRGDKGGRISATTFGLHMAGVIGDAGLIPGQKDPAGVTFHTFRHTFASHLVMRSVDLYTVAQLLGDRLETVEDTYAHLAPDHKREAVRKLAGLLRAAERAEAGSTGRGVEPVTPSDTTEGENASASL